nr:PREDICTED: uncharacterized protein LOC100875525 [Megachile rotundata]XP_012143902.1 PREDICTED: uncharacterized protein LOC100875525 [Megachile rotundata]
MASFWFLDMLALQILHHHKDLDEHHISVLISWLIGEITLLRDRKCSREEFFKEMEEIFMVATDEISEQNKLLYWDEVVYENNAEEGIEEEETQNSIFREESAKTLQKGQPKELGSNEELSPSQDTTKFSINVDPLFALNKVIESTYDMYANELRYALVYAVFVTPIEIQTYNLPFVIRAPRPPKFVDKTMSFSMRLRENMKKIKAIERLRKSIGKRRDKAIEIVPATPAPSLDDEKMLIDKRLYILPLAEANEEFEVFESQLSSM